MRKLITISVILLMLGVLLNGVYQQSVEFKDQKSALTNELSSLEHEVEMRLVQNWQKVVSEYLSEEELHHINQLCLQAATDPHSDCGNLAGKIAREVRLAVRQQMLDKNDSPVTDKRLKARLLADQRIARIYDISHAKNNVSIYTIILERAETKEDLQRIQTDLKPKRETLARLLQ